MPSVRFHYWILSLSLLLFLLGGGNLDRLFCQNSKFWSILFDLGPKLIRGLILNYPLFKKWNRNISDSFLTKRKCAVNLIRFELFASCCLSVGRVLIALNAIGGYKIREEGGTSLCSFVPQSGCTAQQHSTAAHHTSTAQQTTLCDRHVTAVCSTVNISLCSTMWHAL